MYEDSIARIPLRARDGSVRAYAIVDATDAAFVNQWRWSLNEGYAVRGTGYRGSQHVYLHRALLGLTHNDGLEGDHIDRNRLNCRRGNLRAIPKGGNRQNHPSRGHTSSYRGVCWSTKERKWIAQIMTDGKNIRIGCFADEIEAANAAKNARHKLHPYATD